MTCTNEDQATRIEIVKPDQCFIVWKILQWTASGQALHGGIFRSRGLLDLRLDGLNGRVVRSQASRSYAV
jgi:hypothetical protein